MSSLHAPADSLGSSSTSHAGKPPILCLPPETLRDIFAFAQPADLASLSRVSRSFRDLAAAELYRSLAHVFSDDPETGNVSVDSLAGILETLTTSDYNYAANIKEIRLDTAYSGEPGERAMREFKYEYSCGKFLNTLFLSTIKKIASLETFRWNIRVEISPSVFAALGKLDSLQNLHVRLQAGPSLHGSSSKNQQSPAPFHFPPSSVASPLTTHGHQHHHHAHHHHQPPTPATISPYMINNKLPDSNVKLVKRLGVHKLRHGPRNFSWFSNLKSLAVLDMDTLEYVSEIAACINSSTTSLKELKLSFSDGLALKARKKVVVTDHSDTETTQEDDEMFNDPLLPSPPPPPMMGETSTFAGASTFASNDADMRRELAAQEKVLAQIFSLEKDNEKHKRLEKATERAIAGADKEANTYFKTSTKEHADRMFAKELHNIIGNLIQKKNDHAAALEGLKSIESIEKAATKYLEKKGSFSGPQKRPQKSFQQPFPHPKMPAHKLYPKPVFGHPIPPPGKININTDLLEAPYVLPAKPSTMGHSKHPLSSVYYPPKPGSSKKIMHGKPPKPPASSWKPQSSHPVHTSSLSSSPTSEAEGMLPFEKGVVDHFQTFMSPFKQEGKKSEDDYLDVVDMEHPDYDEDEGEDQEFIDTIDDSAEDRGKPSSGIDASSNFVNGSHVDDEPRSKDSGKGKEAVLPNSNAEAGPSNACSCTSEEEGSDSALQEYIRLHHGLPLQSLSIYLIPVKPSVLCRAVNMTALKHISLMNVGPQRAFWAMLAKLHKTTPLQIESIHTDNVSPAFLTFANGLDYVEELFMLERTSRARVENLAPKSTVLVEDITNLVLRKHSRHLVRLMIRNDENASWALNKEAVKLITRHGSQLKELVVGVGSTKFHLLMQHIGGLRSLNILNVIFYHNDFCTSLLREIRSCAVDNVLHCPHLKVRYVAVSYMMGAGPVSTTISEIVRKPKQGTKLARLGFPIDKEGKGKGKAVEVPGDSSYGAFPSMEDLFGDSDTDDEFEGDVVGVVEGVKLRNVVGARVWQKEVWGLTL